MSFKKITLVLILTLHITQAFCQNATMSDTDNIKKEKPFHKFFIRSPYLTFTNFGGKKTNTHHYELHFGYRLTDKDKIGIKVTTWKLFAPLGIPLWDPLFLKESEFYPGRLQESGIGIIYQRMLWKGLYASVEVMPLKQTFLDLNNNKIGEGFRLYTSYHIGYHISMFKNRFFIEPQIHCNYWPIESKGLQSFKEKDNKWNNYFLFEPNLYIGVNF